MLSLKDNQTNGKEGEENVFRWLKGEQRLNNGELGLFASSRSTL